MPRSTPGLSAADKAGNCDGCDPDQPGNATLHGIRHTAERREKAIRSILTRIIEAEDGRSICDYRHTNSTAGCALAAAIRLPCCSSAL
jgi:hypothetical protein